MHFSSVNALITKGRAHLAKGPIAAIIAEDDIEIDSTLRHHLALGFAQIILFCPPALSVPPALADQIIQIDADTTAENAATHLINPLIAAIPGRWLYYCYNAEYLFFPFCETRSVAELLSFHAQEKRDAMRAVVLDLYPGDLAAHPSGAAPEDAWFDGAGYFSQAVTDAEGAPLARSDAIFGGLRWRFEQDIPHERRNLDRVPLFLAEPDLTLGPDHRLSDPERNTIACEWHHNLTAVVASFRCAKALVTNTAMSNPISNFRFDRSVPFEWQSDQLMALGFMEPGQWF